MTKLNRHAAAVAPALPVTALGLTGYFFIGTAAVLIPSVMPFITTEYMATGLTLAAIGLIFPARAVGGILGNLLAGVSAQIGSATASWSGLRRWHCRPPWPSHPRPIRGCCSSPVLR